MLAQRLAQYRTLPQANTPLLLLLDRREPVSRRVFEEWLHVLSPQEQQRLGNLRQTADRDRFVLGRGLLRQLLGLWLNRSAREVQIEIGSYGKPFCPAGPEFNVSHSGDLVLIGIHPCQPIGVDVEQIRVGLEWQPIARRFWSVDVLNALSCLPESDQCSAFTQCWCQYEAISKACGWGLLTASPGELRCQGDGVWPIRLPQSGYRAAVALITQSDQSRECMNAVTSP